MMNQKICAVIVTYNIGKEIIKCFSSIKNQVDKVIIVDNGSNSETINTLKKLNKTYDKLSIIYNNENMGIAAALNKGVKYALKRGYDWILTLDHDSEASSDMVKKLLDAYNLLIRRGINKIGIIAANPYDINSNRYLYRKMRKTENKLVKSNIVISSGSLINSKVFREIGYFNELLFLYYVDNDFCLRCRDKGWNIYVCRSAILYHQEGKKEIKKLLGITMTYDNYTPHVRYYISRNLVHILRNYWYKYPECCTRSFLRLFLDIFKIMMYANDKIEHIYLIIKGLCDGLRGKYGKLEA